MKYIKLFENFINLKNINLDELEDLFLLLVDGGYSIIINRKGRENDISQIVPYPKKLIKTIFGNGFLDTSEYISGVVNNDRVLKAIVVSISGLEDDKLILKEINQIEKRLPNGIKLYGVTSFNIHDYENNRTLVRYDFSFVSEKDLKYFKL